MAIGRTNDGRLINLATRGQGTHEAYIRCMQNITMHISVMLSAVNVK